MPSAQSRSEEHWTSVPAAMNHPGLAPRYIKPPAMPTQEAATVSWFGVMRVLLRALTTSEASGRVKKRSSRRCRIRGY